MSDASTDKLVAALLEAGAPEEFITLARANHFHDYKGASAFPVHELIEMAERYGLPQIAARAKNGDFDAGREEADEWAASPDGQAAIASLFSGSADST